MSGLGNRGAKRGCVRGFVFLWSVVLLCALMFAPAQIYGEECDICSQYAPDRTGARTVPYGAWSDPAFRTSGIWLDQIGMRYGNYSTASIYGYGGGYGLFGTNAFVTALNHFPSYSWSMPYGQYSYTNRTGSIGFPSLTQSYLGFGGYGFGGGSVWWGTLGWQFGLYTSKPKDSQTKPTEPTVLVNIQVDAEIRPGADNVTGVENLVNELKERGINATVFVSGAFANQNQLLIFDIYQDGFEIALHGYNSGEQLATMSYSEQKTLLQNAKTALEGCFSCGTYKPVVGFRPQYFSQDANTYQVLDELGLTYNCGFKVGQDPYVEGHKDDTWPFPMEGYDFCVLPVSRGEFDGQTVYLCDIAMANVDMMSAEEWGGLLSDSLDRAISLDEPLVILFHNWYTGLNEAPTSGEEGYWKPFMDFLTEAKAKGAAFVTANKMVEDFCR
ncbi:MAG: polysaccharide deacetylase family protein [bacterium]